MLVGHAVFVEEVGHFFGDHVPVVGDGDQGNFFPGLRLRGWLRRCGRLLRGLGSIHGQQYTPTERRVPGLLEGFQRRLFRKLVLAGFAGHEVDGLADRHHDTKVQVHASVLADWAGEFLQPVGYVRLGSQVEFHVGVDGEGVAALETGALPFSIRLHAPAVDREPTGFADGATDRAEPGFDLFDGEGHGVLVGVADSRAL